MKEDEQILDIGDASAQQLAEILKNAKTILWNGPVGVFEFPNFRKGTEIVANAIADSEAFSIAGGGDTLAAIDLFGIADKIPTFYWRRRILESWKVKSASRSDARRAR